MDFWLSYGTLAAIYVLLGLSTNLLVGIAGIFSVSQAAVFGVGAYIVSYLLMNEIVSFLLPRCCWPPPILRDSEYPR